MFDNEDSSVVSLLVSYLAMIWLSVSDFAGWVWGIATEELSIRASTALYNLSRPWRWPVIRNVLAHYRTTWHQWRHEFRAQPHRWRILNLAMLTGIGVAYGSAMLFQATTGETIGPLAAGWFVIICAIIAVIQSAMFVLLARDRLIPWWAARR